MKKRTAFWITLINLNLIIVLLALTNTLTDSVGIMIIMAIVGNCGIYTGFNVADNWQRSKYFVSELKESVPNEIS